MISNKENILNKKTVLITGSSGYLGSSIYKILKTNFNIIRVTQTSVGKNSYSCDLSNITEVMELSKKIAPEIIIHAAGLKNIQLCEDNQDLAYQMNTKTVENICINFPESKIIYISSDYVFKGDRGLYSEADKPNPITVYGESKYQGELIGSYLSKTNFIILRTASIYSKNSSFINFLNINIQENLPIKCFINSIFSPTYIHDLCIGIERIISSNHEQPIYHISGRPISRYDFAYSYFEAGNFNMKLLVKEKKDSKHKYLFNDLSLSNKITQGLLGLQNNSLKASFREIINESIEDA